MNRNILRSENKSSNMLYQAIPFLGLVLVCIFFQIATKGKMFSSSNIKAFSNYAFQMVIPACGTVFLMAQGQLDFSMAGNVCICCILAAKASYISPWLAPLVAILVGIGIGLINGSAHVYLGVPSFVATIATSFLYGGLANALLGGGTITSDYALKKADTLLTKYGIILLMLVVTWLVLNFTPYGKQCKAIGAREEVARQSGIDVAQNKMLAFVICGLSCGIMASFVLFRTCCAATTSGSQTHFNAILALLLGGVPFSGGWAARFRCVLIGSMLMAVVTLGLTIMNISPNAQQIIKGIMFTIAVAISFDRRNTAVIQ